MCSRKSTSSRHLAATYPVYDSLLWIRFRAIWIIQSLWTTNVSQGSGRGVFLLAFLVHSKTVNFMKNKTICSQPKRLFMHSIRLQRTCVTPCKYTDWSDIEHCMHVYSEMCALFNRQMFTMLLGANQFSRACGRVSGNEHKTEENVHRMHRFCSWASENGPLHDAFDTRIRSNSLQSDSILFKQYPTRVVLIAVEYSIVHRSCFHFGHTVKPLTRTFLVR